MIEIKKCTCKHEFQDKEYGAGMRVCNVGSNKSYAACTVCGKDHKLNGAK